VTSVLSHRGSVDCALLNPGCTRLHCHCNVNGHSHCRPCLLAPLPTGIPSNAPASISRCASATGTWTSCSGAGPSRWSTSHHSACFVEGRTQTDTWCVSATGRVDKLQARPHGLVTVMARATPHTRLLPPVQLCTVQQPRPRAGPMGPWPTILGFTTDFTDCACTKKVPARRTTPMLHKSRSWISTAHRGHRQASSNFSDFTECFCG
jgi:hypothetical protein